MLHETPVLETYITLLSWSFRLATQRSQKKINKSQAASSKMGIASSSPLPAVSNPSCDATATLYFGYGSNMWREQMERRCPQSSYIGLGRLPDHRWFINERGYANVEPLEPYASNNLPNVSDREAYGLVYALGLGDEAKLDVNEGVPFAYEKQWLEVELWTGKKRDEDVEAESKENSTTDADADGKDAQPPAKNLEEREAGARWPPLEKQEQHQGQDREPAICEMLVYVDRRRRRDGLPRVEYVTRMNEAVVDALEAGVPSEYVENVIRHYIPEKAPEPSTAHKKKKAGKSSEEG